MSLAESNPDTDPGQGNITVDYLKDLYSQILRIPYSDMTKEEIDFMTNRFFPDEYNIEELTISPGARERVRNELMIKLYTGTVIDGTSDIS